MFITVREVLEIRPLTEATLLAGSAGLDRVIKSITVMDTPDIEKWLQGGEFLLTNAYVVRDKQARLVSMLETINDKGVAALGVKVRDFIEDIVPELARVCERIGLPLISIPLQHPWVDVINPLLGEVINRQVKLLKHALNVHEEMSETILQGGGLGRVAERLAELVDAPVTILDERWKPLLTARGQTVEAGVLSAARQAITSGIPAHSTAVTAGDEVAHIGPRRAIVVQLPNGRRAAVVAMSAGTELYGYILLPELDRRLGPFDLVAIEQGALAASLEVLRRRTEKTFQRRLRDTFLFDLLSGRIDNRDLALARAKARGWDLTGPHVVALISLDQSSDIPESLDPVGNLRRTATRALEPRHRVVWLELTDGVVLCIALEEHEASPTAVKDTLRCLGEKLSSAVSGTYRNLSTTVGLGRIHTDPMKLSVSYREASQAVSLGRHLWDGDRVVLFDELGFYRILAQYPVDSEEVAGFCEETLGALIEYDRKHNSDLIKTLEVYLDCLGSWAQAAEILNVHPNTLGYRIARIGELLGIDLKLPDQRLSLELAIKILRLRGARHG